MVSLRDPSTKGSKGHFESPGKVFFLKIILGKFHQDQSAGWSPQMLVIGSGNLGITPNLGLEIIGKFAQINQVSPPRTPQTNKATLNRVMSHKD